MSEGVAERRASSRKALSFNNAVIKNKGAL
jgi:hypothetical protein